MSRLLSLPDQRLIRLLREHKVIDCGAGSGLWLRVLHEDGIDAVGIDPAPGPGVLMGTHLDLAQYRDRLLLAVWPRDGTDLDEWVSIWGGDMFVVIGAFSRFTLGDYRLAQERWFLPPLFKCPSEVRVMYRT